MESIQTQELEIREAGQAELSLAQAEESEDLILCPKCWNELSDNYCSICDYNAEEDDD